MQNSRKRIAESKSPILLTGTGRCGTTILAQILSHQPEFLYVEEPNFITDLFLPFQIGQLNRDQFLSGLHHEGWRGPMKFCRTMSEMYPAIFGDDGCMPIRPYMRERMLKVIEQSGESNSQQRLDIIKIVLYQIIRQTCFVAGRPIWFVKQPSAIIFWRELLHFWPDLKIIHLTRRLEFVVQSRLKRGYQSSFEDALHVCETRLRSVAKAWETLPAGTICNISIEGITASPQEGIDTIFCFLGLTPNKAVVDAVSVLNETALYRSGKPSDLFQPKELVVMSNLRGEINSVFGEIYV